MNEFPESLETLIEQYRKLPTIGKKTAQRLALHTVGLEGFQIDNFISALRDVKEKIHHCNICGNITEKEICAICADHNRDHSTICVVEDITNLIAIERGGSYRGVYHVLDGLLSPMQDFGPDQIGVDDLLKRMQSSAELADSDDDNRIKEVILAISATVEGETTMLFLAELLKKYDVKVTRIASGIPVGGSLEYYDELTLSKALEDRRGMAD